MNEQQESDLRAVIADMKTDLELLQLHLEGQGIDGANDSVWLRINTMRGEIKLVIDEVEARADEFGGPGG